MSRINDLIRQVARTDETLATDLQREVAALADRRSFGLNFERHIPEVVELPGRPVRRGDKVRILPPRGEKPTKADERLWRVAGPAPGTESDLMLAAVEEGDTPLVSASRDDLVVVAEFRDPIYPGLVSTGKVERGGDKPFHTVINAENYHALQALLFTHRGKVDAIYIDPPYNTGAKDWKYNNDYVEGDDLYRHSKWLAFMERRLLLAKDLLNPDDSILVIAIDENELNRLTLIAAQVLPEGRHHVITSVTSQRGVARSGTFTRVNEYLLFVFVGDARIEGSGRDSLASVSAEKSKQMWFQFRRNGKGSLRSDSPNLFYPLFIEPSNRRIVAIGDPLPRDADRHAAAVPDGCEAVWPLREDGTEARWRAGVDRARAIHASGYLRVAPFNAKKRLWPVLFVTEGGVKAIDEGEVQVVGREPNGDAILDAGSSRGQIQPKTVWNLVSHDAGWHGSRLLQQFVPGREFPYPKSLFALEDALSLITSRKPDATIVDFFSGSGTTAHAAMRLNKRDGGRRRSISITNNEVSADEQRTLREGGLRPGDEQWEALGICDYITKPRITAAVTGKTPDDDPIKGDYKFNDVFPMADGLEENVEFFTLTYEAPLRVASHRDFERIAPLLWLRAGSRGRRIDDVSAGWDVAEAYGVLADLDLVDPFLEAARATPGVGIAFVITDEDRLFETISRELPDQVEPVRLYESYLRNFEIASGRGAL